MGPYDDITFFSKYQTFLVGLLGFIGIIATLWWNARLARTEREAVAAHERATLRIAMIEELKLVKGAFELRIEQSDPKTADYSFIPKKLPVVVYDRLVERIGLLRNEEVAAVMHAYGLVQQLPERLGLLDEKPEQDDASSTSSPSEWYFFVKGKHLDKVRLIHESYLPVIDEAIRKLEINVQQPKA